MLKLVLCSPSFVSFYLIHFSQDEEGVALKAVSRDEGSTEAATVTEPSASGSNEAGEGGGATAEQANSSEAANEEEEDAEIWQRRRSLQASGNASQAEGMELTNEAMRPADAAQAATATDGETGNCVTIHVIYEVNQHRETFMRELRSNFLQVSHQFELFCTLIIKKKIINNIIL